MTQATLNPQRPPAGRLSLLSCGAVALITLAGAVLRLAAARGDLWLDEIWSFRILANIGHFRDIVFALPYDNNHVLTTAWLAVVGPQTASVLVRLPAVVFGTLCIPVAAWIGSREGSRGAIVAAALVAFDEVFVGFGSEARGYSGMILATLIAFKALETQFERPDRANLLLFALAIGFGMFSHLTMVEPVAVLCASAFGRLALSKGIVGLWRATLPIFCAALLGTLPALCCFAISLSSGPLHIGLVTPFTVEDFLIGLGRMVRADIGLFDGPLDESMGTLLLAGVTIAVVGALFSLPRERRVFPALAILALPILHALLRVPNQQYPRFHLTVAIGLMLLVIDVWPRVWRHGGIARSVAGVIALAFLVGQAFSITHFLAVQRGQYLAATALLTQNQGTSVTVLPLVQAGETRAVIQWYARALGRDAPNTSGPRIGCEDHPTDWLLTVSLPYDIKELDPVRPIGPGSCPVRYDWAATYPAYGFSGFTWTLYRRTN